MSWDLFILFCGIDLKGNHQEHHGFGLVWVAEIGSARGIWRQGHLPRVYFLLLFVGFLSSRDGD